MRRARVRGSGGATSSPSIDATLGKEEPRRSRVGERVVSEGATRAVGTSATSRRDVFSAISEFSLGGSKPVGESVRGASCGGVQGGNGEELSRCAAARAAVLGAAFARGGGEEEVVEMGVELNQEGGGNSVAFWLLFSFSFCLPFLPNLTNCSRAWILARGRVSLVVPSVREEEAPDVVWWLTADRSLVERLRRADDGFVLAMIVRECRRGDATCYGWHSSTPLTRGKSDLYQSQ